MRFTATSLSLLVALTCTACPQEEELEPATDCSADPSSGEPDTLAQREVEIGEVVDGVFTPWVDGQDVTLVTGFQGAPMLTPWLQLPGEDDDVDGSCWRVRYDHLDEEGMELGGSYASGLLFSLVDDVMRTGPIFDTPYGSEGDTAHIRVSVDSPEFSATGEVSVVLRY